MKANYTKLAVLSLGHIINDWYMNYIPVLLPFLILAGIDVSRAAFLISAFTITSSLSQPCFGYLVDQKNQRWLVYVGTIWMAVLLGLLGVVNSYPVMLSLSILAGFGTAAFHPQASAMASGIDLQKKGMYLSIFVAGGNLGWALTPLLLVPFIETYGLSSTPWIILPGIVAAVILWTSSPKVEKKAFQAPVIPLRTILKQSGRELLKIITIVTFRSLAYFGLIAFLPLYLHERNISLISGGRLLFFMLIGGAIGGIIGGTLSDHFGRKKIIIVSLLASSPLFFIFLNNVTSLFGYTVLILAGIMLLSSFSVTIVSAQELIRKNAAMASGLILGFGQGVGGLGVGIIGLLSKSFGLPVAIHTLIWLPLIAGLLGFTLKKPSSQ